MHARGFTAGQKTIENQDWATGPPGRRTAGPSRAVGRGPLGRGPVFSKTPSETIPDSAECYAGLSVRFETSAACM